MFSFFSGGRPGGLMDMITPGIITSTIASKTHERFTIGGQTSISNSDILTQ
jgi:hypothetical protein